MIVTNAIYDKYVVDDLKNYKGLTHPVKSSILSRIKPKYINPAKLHPNPDDEFSMDTVGPSWTIISNYEESIRMHMQRGEDIFDHEPIIVVKLDKGGYMILNGHHRWMASLKLRVAKVPIKIVNITLDEDIYKVINKSTRNKCVTIDFDEVLFSDDFQETSEKIPFPQNLIYKKNIRDKASLLIQEFQRLGFDVWIYTGGYLSEQYIKGLFFINKCHVDGIVNGINGKRNAQKLRDVFRTKYDTILHVDNEAITFVNTRTKKFDVLDINASSEEWASATVSLAGDFDLTTLND